MLDDLVGDPTPVGGFQHRRSRDSQLVDDTDEGTRSHRGPQGEDSDPHDLPINFRGDDRRGRDEEQVTQIIGVVAPGLGIGAAKRKNADCGVKIGESGVADVNLHEGLSGAIRSERAADDPTEDTTDGRMNLLVRTALLLTMSRKPIAPHLRAPV